MGAGIARIFADGGASVRLTARRQESLDAARERANRAAESALAHLLEIPDDTTVLAEIVNGLAVRTA